MSRSRGTTLGIIGLMGLACCVGVWALGWTTGTVEDIRNGMPLAGEASRLPEVAWARLRQLDLDLGDRSERLALTVAEQPARVVRGTVVVAPGMGPATSVQLFWSGAGSDTESEVIPLDPTGSFEFETSLSARRLHASVQLLEGPAPAESPADLSDPLRLLLEVGFGRVQPLRCVDSAARPVAGVTVVDLGRDALALPTSGPLGPELRAREVGTSDSTGAVRLSDLPIGGTNLGFLGDGLQRVSRFVIPTADGRPSVIDLVRLQDLEGVAPDLDGHQSVRISIGRDVGLGADRPVRTWVAAAGVDPVGQVVVERGACFALSRTRRGLPVLECRSLDEDALLALGTANDSGQYTEWWPPEQTVVTLDLQALPHAGTNVHLELSWAVGDVDLFEQVPVDQGSSRVRQIPLGSVFLGQRVRIAWVEDLRATGFVEGVLQPGEQALRLEARESTCSARITVRSSSSAMPVEDAQVEVRTLEGEPRASVLRTDRSGSVLFEVEPGQTYLARARSELGRGAAEFRVPLTPDARLTPLGLWVQPTTARLEVELGAAVAGDVRLGLALIEDLGPHACLVELASSSGPTNKAPWEARARRMDQGAGVAFEGLTPGRYMVYARPLPPEPGPFLELTAGGCAGEVLRGEITLEAERTGRLVLTPPATRSAWVQLEFDPNADVDLGAIVVEALPAWTSGGAVRPAGRVPVMGRYLGGGLFEVALVREGEHQVRILGVGPIPVTSIHDLAPGRTTRVVRDRSWELSLEGEFDAGAALALRIMATGLDDRGRAVSGRQGAEWVSLDAPVPGQSLRLTSLDPTAQYTAELSVGERRFVRVLRPLPKGTPLVEPTKQVFFLIGR